ncbi:MAG: hypothetical protein Fur0022_14530 [Anaerolineales bacterium]
MNSHNFSEDEMDSLFAHSLKNWGAKQNPPVYVRSRLLRQAAQQTRGSKLHQMSEEWLLRVRALNPYWTGRPLSHAELAKWLFAQAMLDGLRMERDALRVVC